MRITISMLIAPLTLFLLTSSKTLLAEDLTSSDIKQLMHEMSELKKLVKSQGDRIEALESENSSLKNTASQQQPSEPPPPASTGSLSTFNPEIGVVADITGISSESKEDADGNDKLSVRELELVFGHDIDPYSRFDSTLTLSDFEDPDIEEAYITYFDLPGDIKMKLGRMREKVGKASAIHRDQLETVDDPLVVQQFLGSEGLFKTGLELTSILPWSGDSFVQELTLGTMEGGVGEGGSLLDDDRRHPSIYGHLKNYYEISDSSDFELGGTYLVGSNGDGDAYNTNLFGLDATYITYLSPINRLKFSGEIYLQDRDAPSLSTLSEGEIPSDFDSSPLGFYTLADYRFSERFGLGGRFDYVEPVNLFGGDDNTLAYTGYLTFYQSEFSRWRAQYQYLTLPDGTSDNRFFVQTTVAIGVHKHQLQ